MFNTIFICVIVLYLLIVLFRNFSKARSNKELFIEIYKNSKANHKLYNTRKAGISKPSTGGLILFGSIFLAFFILLASNYVPLLFGEKIESTIVGIDSVYHKPKRYYMWSYYPVIKYSKENITEKRLIYTSPSKKENIKIGQKREVYYLKGYGIVDPKETFLSNAITITSFIICFVIGIAFYSYAKGYL